MTSIVPRRNDGLQPLVRTAARGPDWMLRQLPVGLLESDFFVRFVSLFQEAGESLLSNADNIDNILDLTVAPQPMVNWLGSWIGVDSVDTELSHEFQRRLVSSAAQTLTWRGTRFGLERFLSLISDGPATVTEGGGVWRGGEAPDDTAWVRMSVESTGSLSEGDFVQFVTDEVPAHVRAELYVGERLIWASDGTATT